MNWTGLLAELAHLAAGLLVLAGFAQLVRRRRRGLVQGVAAQGALVVLTALCQGGLQAAPWLLPAAALTALLRLRTLPAALAALPETAPGVEAGTAPGLRRPAAGVALAALALLAALPRAGGAALLQQDLALALAAALLALLLAAARQDLAGRAVGLLGLEAAASLALLHLPVANSPLPALLATVLPGALPAAIAVRRRLVAA